MISFAALWALVLLPLPWLSDLLRRRPQDGVPVNGDDNAPVLPQAPWLSGLTDDQATTTAPPERRTQANRIWTWLIWALLVLALARPQHVGEPVSPPVSGRDLMLAVDISPSMEETDMVAGGRPVDRLQALKVVLDDFIAQRQGDRLGLLLFATEAYIQVPMTFDHVTLRTLLDESDIGMAGRATAIGDAIGLAVKRLRERPQQQRVLILLTDGANTAGEITPEQATELAGAAGVRIHTVGIGADRMVRQGLFGPREVNPSEDLDEDQLRHIASGTGGQYFRARNRDDLQAIYQAIDQLEPIELEGRRFRPVKELFYWPLAAAGLIWLSLLLTPFSAPRLASAWSAIRGTLPSGTSRRSGR